MLGGRSGAGNIGGFPEVPGVEEPPDPGPIFNASISSLCFELSHFLQPSLDAVDLAGINEPD